jgi:hypothetical protein
MNITLWIIAGLLAIAYLTVGTMKIVRPYESIVANRNMAWAEDVAPAGVKVIGGIEIIGALGLIFAAGHGHRRAADSPGGVRSHSVSARGVRDPRPT